ncbi:hypothetical protein ILYODFUR_029312 [Ilyodon furcidens]|uniref:Uncharacterized protein n=1 Tax=Ilyodon furcidens TaxID=33524 RepID=A0ABV0VKW3_9TELE
MRKPVQSRCESYHESCVLTINYFESIQRGSLSVMPKANSLGKKWNETSCKRKVAQQSRNNSVMNNALHNFKQLSSYPDATITLQQGKSGFIRPQDHLLSFQSSVFMFPKNVKPFLLIRCTDQWFSSGFAAA